MKPEEQKLLDLKEKVEKFREHASFFIVVYVAIY